MPSLSMIRSAGALALASAVLVVPAHAQQAGQYTLSGHEVAIYDVAGRIELAAGPGPDVRVEVTRGGHDASRLSVATGDVDGRPTLRVIYPSDDIHYDSAGWGERTTIRVRANGTFGRDGHRVRIHGLLGGLDAHADLRILIPAGKRVAVFLGMGRVEGTDLKSDVLVNVATAPVHIDGMDGALLVDTGSGSVDVTGVSGAASIRTGSGSVRVSRIRGAELKAETGSGSVRGDSVDVASLALRTGSGGIDVRTVSAPKLVLHTGSGHITLGLTSDVEDAHLTTGSGGVTAYLPASLGAQLDVRTGSGGIHTDLPVRITRMAHSRLEGRLGDGAGQLVIRTGSGSVHLEVASGH